MSDEAIAECFTCYQNFNWKSMDANNVNSQIRTPVS